MKTFAYEYNGTLNFACNINSQDINSLMTGGVISEADIEGYIEDLVNVKHKDGSVTTRNREEIEPFIRGLCYGGLTESEAIMAIALKDSPNGIIPTLVKNVPTDFKGAWKLNDDEITIDMEKARLIQMDNIRKVRADKFIEMGFPYQLDANLELAIIPEETRIQLQNLRDITATFDLNVAQTPEQLKNLFPEELK